MYEVSLSYNGCRCKIQTKFFSKYGHSGKEHNLDVFIHFVFGELIYIYLTSILKDIHIYITMQQNPRNWLPTYLQILILIFIFDSVIFKTIYFKEC